MSGWVRRCGLTVLAGLVAASAMTGAYARWSARGNGSGTATTGTALPVTLAPGTAGAALYPSASAPVNLVATNPNPGPVLIPRLALDTTRGTAGLAVDAAHAGCTTGGITVTASDNQGLGWTVPGSGSLAISVPGALTADATLANGCQGATLTIYLKAS